MAEYNAATAELEDDIRTEQSHFDVTTEEVRAGFEDFIRVNFDETGLLSRSQVASQRQYVERVLSNPDPSSRVFRDLAEAYVGTYAERSKAENMRAYWSDAVGPLKNAVDSGVISAASYRQWIDWLRDPGRDAPEKKSSIARALPDYLSERRALATKRNAILRDARFKGLLESSDPRHKELASGLREDTHFLEKLSFEERKKLVVEVLNLLPLADADETLFKKFEAELDKAVKNEWISEGSKKKWVARFKDPSVNPRARAYFVTSQFPSYVTAWHAVHTDREKHLGNPLLKELTTKDMKEIAVLLDGKKFRDLHHNKKTSMLAEARAVLTAKKGNKDVLLKETRNVMEAAAAAGYISSNKVGPWLEHVIGGKRTLGELKEFIKDWAKVRFRYDKISQKMSEGKVPQGLQRVSEETFLNLSYEQRLSYVDEAERRLHIETESPKDTPIQDAKGKVRHALDTENWEEAEYFLAKAWPLAKNEEDIHELQSMEKFLRSFGKKREAGEATEKRGEEVQNAYKEIELVLSLLPVGLQPIYRKALMKGADCLQCVTTTVYNRTWCQERGYLTESLEERLRERSIQETAELLSPTGGGHHNGRENMRVDGFQQPAIRDKGVGPENLFLSGGGADAFVEKADANKSTWSFWYWTNLIVDGVSAGQNNFVAYSLNHRIKRAARTLQRHGLLWSEFGPPVSLN